MPFTKNDGRMEYVEPKEHHIPYARLQAIARRVGWPSEAEETHLAVCDECRGKIEKMRKATLGI